MVVTRAFLGWLPLCSAPSSAPSSSFMSKTWLGGMHKSCSGVSRGFSSAIDSAGDESSDGGGDGSVYGAGSRGKEREVGYEAVEEGGGEGMLRREAVADGHDAGAGVPREGVGHGAGAGGVHEVQGAAMDVQYRAL